VELSVAVAVSISESWSRRSAQACTLLIDKLELSADPSFRSYVVDCFMEHHSRDLNAELNRLPIFAAVAAHRLVHGASHAEFAAVVGLLSRAGAGHEPEVDLHRLAENLVTRGQSGVLNRGSGIIRCAIFTAENPVVERRLCADADASVDDVRELDAVAVAAEDVAPVERLAVFAQRR
jgi:hypothetical protein